MYELHEHQNQTPLALGAAVVLGLIYLIYVLKYMDDVYFNILLFSLVVGTPLMILYCSSKKTHLIFGADKRSLYFPLKNMSMQFIPMDRIENVLFSQAQVRNTNRDSWHEREYHQREVISVKLRETEALVIGEPRWGGSVDLDKDEVCIGFSDRKKALEVLNGINQLLKSNRSEL